MKTKSGAPRAPITSQQVSDEIQKHETLSRHFPRDALKVESSINGFMHSLCSKYPGGPWHIYELSNGGLYMAPEWDATEVQVRVEMHKYEGRMSVDAAAITACLIAFSTLAFETLSDTIIRHYYLLRDFAQEHRERKAIFTAID